MTLEESILKLVGAPGYRPIKPRTIAQRLKLPKDRAADVRKAVKQLVRDGRIAYSPNHLVTPVATTGDVAPRKRTSRGLTAPGNPPGKTPGKRAAKPSANRLLGVFQRAQKGFGFVRLRGGEPGVELKDVYVPADRTADAATGDVVMVRVDRARRGGPGPRGEIVEIVERQTRQFVGTYFESAGAAYVRIDGTLFARPIYVGDPGAKNARTDDKVVTEMLRFPSPLRDGEGVITEVLGPRGKPGVDTLSIIREFGIPDQFADDALEEARRLAERFDESIGGRL
ncbi:MAG: hypothetical protein KKE86_13095, partial [Planctomycetes bacterium]|nr:hypothetical protein [Planctomycetota bacterium]